MCLKKFGNNERMPLKLICGHTFCKTCISDYFNSHKSVRCFIDQRDFGYKSIDDIAMDNEQLLKIK